MKKRNPKNAVAISKLRLFFLMSVLVAGMAGMLGRVLYIQLTQGQELAQKAREQQSKSTQTKPVRGSILDRNGKEMAVSLPLEKVYLSTIDIEKSVKNNQEKLSGLQNEIATTLSEYLNIDKKDIMSKFSTKSHYVLIQRQVDRSITQKIREWRDKKKIAGVYLEDDSKRFYPNKTLASHVLGFVDSDSAGLAGVEKTMDDYLKGQEGRVLGAVDANGHQVLFDSKTEVPTQNGYQVVLTIDAAIQNIIETELAKAIDENKVKNGAAALVMSPKTGEILAMASLPDFDSNAPKAAPAGTDAKTWKPDSPDAIRQLQKTVWRNKTVVDTYEPGSTFKAITSAAGLEEKVVTPDTPVNDFTVKVANWNIDCWQPNAHGNETFRQGVWNSCNPVFVRVAQNLGIDTFYKYVRAFGFYDVTGLGLPGEAGSIIHTKPTEVDMAAASFGQRLQVSPVAMIQAYGAIANGGTLMRPQLVREIRDQQGRVVKGFSPVAVRTVISRQTSDTLRDILEGVVAQGTGKNAYVKGYRIAGKTGTSETTEDGRVVASFMCFAPADDPQICLLILMDNPGVTPHTGGMIAAPVAGRMAEAVLTQMGVERHYTDQDKRMMMTEAWVPDVTGKTVAEGRQMLRESGYEVKFEGVSESDKITVQRPAGGSQAPLHSVIHLFKVSGDKIPQVRVPELNGKNSGEASAALQNAGLNLRSDGIGTAVEQTPKAGTMATLGEVITVKFKHLNTE